MTRWLTTQNTDFYRQGRKPSTHGHINAPSVLGTTGEISKISVKLNIDFKNRVEH